MQLQIGEIVRWQDRSWRVVKRYRPGKTVRPAGEVAEVWLVDLEDVEFEAIVCGEWEALVLEDLGAADHPVLMESPGG
jgi:hypothetical protein